MMQPGSFEEEWARLTAWWDGVPRRTQGLTLLLAVPVITYAVIYGLVRLLIWASFKPVMWAGSDFYLPLGIAGWFTLGVIRTYSREFGLFPRLWLWKFATFFLWANGFLLLWATERDNLRGTWALAAFLLNDRTAKGHEGEVLTRFFFDGYDLKSTVAWNSWLARSGWCLPCCGCSGSATGRSTGLPSVNSAGYSSATLTCAGYPLARYVYGLLDQLDPEDWLIVVRTILPPLLLPLAGMATIGAITLAVIIIGFVFVLMVVTLPLMAFDYLNGRDIKAHIRAQKKQGIAGYNGALSPLATR